MPAVADSLEGRDAVHRFPIEDTGLRAQASESLDRSVGVCLLGAKRTAMPRRGNAGF
jgi:hypothetical protein